MILVAIVAIAIGAEIMRRRWVYRREQAARCAAWEKACRALVARRGAEAAKLREEDRKFGKEVADARKKFEGRTDLQDYESGYLNRLAEIERMQDSLAKLEQQRAPSEAEDIRLFRDYEAKYARLRRAYEYAAWHPWNGAKLEHVDTPP